MKLYNSNEDDDEWGSETSIEQSNNVVDASNSNTEPERDLFIPIFTLVSLVGFFGAYAYETFRLYSQGELYLPWDN